MTKANLQHVLASVDLEAIMEGAVKPFKTFKILSGVDADGSGLIDYTEFLAATLDKRGALRDSEELNAEEVLLARGCVLYSFQLPSQFVFLNLLAANFSSMCLLFPVNISQISLQSTDLIISLIYLC